MFWRKALRKNKQVWKSFKWVLNEYWIVLLRFKESFRVLYEFLIALRVLKSFGYVSEDHDQGWTSHRESQNQFWIVLASLKQYFESLKHFEERKRSYISIDDWVSF